MRALATVALVMAGCMAAAPTDGDDPRGPAPPADSDVLASLQEMQAFPELRFETQHGTIRMLLYTAWTPQTADHVGGLAADGFYDGTLVHRVVDDFVIQGGDRTGTGEGGSGPLGTPDPVPLEVPPGLDFGSGAVGLARWTDDTGDSQWFITEKPALHLSRPSGTTGQVFGAYALFAQVFEGMDVVRAIAAVETVPHLDRPVQDVRVLAAHLLPPPHDVDLLGIVPDVTAGFEAVYGSATLEVPRLLVAGHPADVRVAYDAEACAWPAHAILAVGPGNLTIPLDPVEHDGCTYEGAVTFPTPGEWTIVGSDAMRPDTAAPIVVHVRPWHDDYASFTGAAAPRAAS